MLRATASFQHYCSFVESSTSLFLSPLLSVRHKHSPSDKMDIGGYVYIYIYIYTFMGDKLTDQTLREVEMKTNQTESGVQAEKEGQKALTVTDAPPSLLFLFASFSPPLALT